MKSQKNSNDKKNPNSKKQINWIRNILTIAILGLTIAYVLGIVLGYVPQTQRLDLTTIILITLVFLFSLVMLTPEALERISKLNISTNSIQIELQEVRKQQEKYEKQLTDLTDLVVGIINERGIKVLEALNGDETSDEMKFKVDQELQDAVRQIRSMGLVVKIEGKNVGDMQNHSEIKINEWVKLGKGTRVQEILKFISESKNG